MTVWTDHVKKCATKTGFHGKKLMQYASTTYKAGSGIKKTKKRGKGIKDGLVSTFHKYKHHIRPVANMAIDHLTKNMKNDTERSLARSGAQMGLDQLGKKFGFGNMDGSHVRIHNRKYGSGISAGEKEWILNNAPNVLKFLHSAFVKKHGTDNTKMGAGFWDDVWGGIKSVVRPIAHFANDTFTPAPFRGVVNSGIDAVGDMVGLGLQRRMKEHRRKRLEYKAGKGLYNRV